MPHDSLLPATAANPQSAENFPGLSNEQAAALLLSDGLNELPSSKPRSMPAIVRTVVTEPIFLVLVACGAIYMLLGDAHEAFVLLGFVLFVTLISLQQEYRTERTLAALRDLSSPRALVKRSGIPVRIPGREVARGDVLVLAEGDRVAADARLVLCDNLLTDESLLTGEAMPVRKHAGDMRAPMARPGGEDSGCVYSGTLIVQGRGLAVVAGTGERTEIGRIGKAIQSVPAEPTPLQRETAHWVRVLAVIGIVICLIVVIAYGMTRGSWLDGILAGLTMAMAILPNELPVVLTIFMALGAWRIAKYQVLTRRVPVIEALGSASALCVDKTGTVTLNRMSVRKLYADGESYDVAAHAGDSLPETFHAVMEFAVLASQRDPFDPMERALHEYGQIALAHTEHLHGNWSLVRQYPLSIQLLALSHVWHSPDGRDYIIAAKGSPEAIADLCHFDPARLRHMTAELDAMATDGLRVLGVARARFEVPSLPEQQHDFKFEFLGLIGLADPVRSGVPESVAECSTAGIRVIMITGDYALTATSTARQIAIRNPEQCITGAELDRMDDEELRRRIMDTDVFARVVPEQKLRLVEALKANGHVVAMTGDGVNDAPALKAAHIGIAMGKRGTDVAREAAALVLLDDDFSSIVRAVRLGRRIFDNLRKAIAYTIACHLPIIGMTLVPVAMEWPLVLLPFHVAFLHLIIDPACSVVLEAEGEEADVMRHPPRKARDMLLGRRTLLISLAQGASVLIGVLLVFAIAHYGGRPDVETRALAFATIVFANLALIFANRSWNASTWRASSNPALWWVSLATVGLLGLSLYVPFLRGLFRFGPLPFSDVLISFAVAVAAVSWFEIFKWWRHRRGPSLA